MEISIQAGELVGKLYDEILKLYIDSENEETLKSLNMLCVRLVFCLYAEDSGIFGKGLMFHDYLARFEARDLRRALIDLFRVLDTKIENRDPYLQEELAQFPYVNGGLFANENIEIPNLTETYLSLRKLENEVIFEPTGGQIGFGDERNSPIKVSIRQFYGIEINDFAVIVAKTALWIAESQMMKNIYTKMTK